MEKGAIVQLIETIQGFKKNIYGSYGDKVTVTSVFSNVLIVADSKGRKFPVHESKVKFLYTPSNKTVQPVT